MLRAKSLGAISFTPNTLFIQEEFTNGEMLGEMKMSAAGTHIAYEATISTPYITLDSEEYGIITEAQRALLVGMWELIATTYTLTYDDLSTVEVRMAKEKKLIFTPLWEGACEFRAIIPLAKV